MEKVKDAMRCEGSNDEPLGGSEAGEREAKKNSSHGRLNDENLCRAGDRKEHVVRRDNNHHDRVQRSVSVQAKETGQGSDDESQNRPDREAHAPLNAA